MSEQEQLFMLNPSVRVQPFDGMGRSGSFCISLGTRNFYLNSSALALLERFKTPASVDAALNGCAGDKNQIRDALEKQYIPKELLIPVENGAASRPVPQNTGRSSINRYLFFRMPLLPARVVTSVTSKLCFLYKSGIYWALAATICMLHAVAIAQIRWHGVLFPERMTPTQWFVTIAAAYLSLLFHEFGHATACSYFGEPNGSIGMALYGIYPVFYSDVSRAWRLRRWQRVCVDFGGIYFQGIFSAVCLLLWWEWKILPALACCYSIMLSTVFNLNPFFRFDGYWMIADALGVPRPLHVGRDCLNEFILRIIRGPETVTPMHIEFSIQVRSGLAIFALTSYGFSVWMLYFLVHREIPYLIHSDLTFWQSVSRLHWQSTSYAQATSVLQPAVMPLLISLAMGSGVVMMFSSLMQRLLPPLRKKNAKPLPSVTSAVKSPLLD